MNLFQLGKFNSSAGINLDFKIECDALTEADWDALAYLAIDVLPEFGKVKSVPTGGDRFAHHLKRYTDPHSDRLLIVDDVLTTGKSMSKSRESETDVGIVAFSRGKCPLWIYSIFQLNIGN